MPAEAILDSYQTNKNLDLRDEVFTQVLYWSLRATVIFMYLHYIIINLESATDWLTDTNYEVWVLSIGYFPMSDRLQSYSSIKALDLKPFDLINSVLLQNDPETYKQVFYDLNMKFWKSS